MLQGEPTKEAAKIAAGFDAKILVTIGRTEGQILP